MRVVNLIATLAAFGAAPLAAQINAGGNAPNPVKPFVVTPIATFNLPWKLAFLPDGRMLVTEKPGAMFVVGKDGAKTQIMGVPAVVYQNQQGLLGVYVSPTYAADRSVYITYAEPGPSTPGTMPPPSTAPNAPPPFSASGLALARATLVTDAKGARLDGLKVLWRQLPRGAGGQLGGVIAFAPDGKSLYLTVGERQRFSPAQDMNSELGKILHLTLDGKPAPGNPFAGQKGAASVPLFAPPRNTEEEKTAAKVMVTLPGPNLAPAETWALGFRTPYGMAFSPTGELWEIEHGPRGGDELNLIQKGKNYGWPLVTYGMNYDGVPIPSPDTRPDLQKPAIYWVPIIAPGGLAFYDGSLFPQWRGSGFTGGMASMTLNRFTFDAKGGATPADRWDMGRRIRDVEAGPDGALYLLEDDKEGRLVKLTPSG